jgi:hypothetical protein
MLFRGSSLEKVCASEDGKKNHKKNHQETQTRADHCSANNEQPVHPIRVAP